MMLALRKFLVAAMVGAATVASASAGTLVVAQNFDPQTLWPNGTTASDNLNAGSAIVESLFWVDPLDQKFKPLLATSYERESPTSILVKLREGVQFTDGEPMNADAVIHSFNIFIDKAQTPAYASVAEPFQSIAKVDDHTVRITLKHPYPPIELAMSQIHIVAPAYWDKVGLAGYGQKPIGTGPFKFESWTRDSQLVMSKNEHYWGKLPEGIDEVIWKPVPDDTARAAGITTGEYQIASSLAVASAMDLKQNQDVNVIAVPSYRIFQIILSSLDPKSPLADKRVRQALNYAVDKKAIIDSLFFGKAVLLHGQLLREPQLGFNPAVDDYPYDPTKAKKLLAEDGYPDGFDITFKFPTGRYAQDREVSEAVAGMLAQVGVRAKMVSLEPGEFLRQLRDKELAPMAFVGLAPQDDPDLQLAQYRSTWRYSYMNSPELDNLIDAGKQELDVDKRRKIYEDAAVFMHDFAPVIFLYDGVDFYAATKKLQNFSARGDGRIFLYDLSLSGN